MMRCRTKLVAVLIAGGLLSLQPAYSEAVLCVGTDGHVAIEAGASGMPSSCDGARDHHREGTTAVSVYGSSSPERGSHCGICSDSTIEGFTHCPPGQTVVRAPGSARLPADLSAATIGKSGLLGPYQKVLPLREDRVALRAIVLLC